MESGDTALSAPEHVFDSRKRRRKMLNRLSAPKQLALLLISLALLGFIIYIDWIASFEELRSIGALHIDKLAHLLGGIFIALIYEWRFGNPLRLSRLLALLFGLTIGWEVLEYLFDAETRFFVATYPDLWRLDSAGDVVAALLGSYGYWVFAVHRSGTNADQLHGSNTDQIRV